MVRVGISRRGSTSESVSSLITKTETALETSVYSPFAHLTLLLTREYFIEFSHCKSCKLHFPQGHCVTQSLTPQTMFGTTQMCQKTSDLVLSLRSPILYRLELSRFNNFGKWSCVVGRAATDFSKFYTVMSARVKQSLKNIPAKTRRHTPEYWNVQRHSCCGIIKPRISPLFERTTFQQQPNERFRCMSIL
jgi:hypothetical protein